MNKSGKLDSAIACANTAKGICIEIGDDRGLGYIYSLLAEIHENREEFDLAATEVLAHLKIREEENDPLGVSMCNSVLARIYFKQGSLNEAQNMLVKAEDLPKGFNSLALYSGIYLTWSKVDSSKGNCDKSLLHFRLYSHYK